MPSVAFPMSRVPSSQCGHFASHWFLAICCAPVALTASSGVTGLDMIALLSGRKGGEIGVDRAESVVFPAFFTACISWFSPLRRVRCMECACATVVLAPAGG